MKLELKPILSMADIPSGVAVHGTSRKAWEAIGAISLGGLLVHSLIFFSS